MNMSETPAPINPATAASLPPMAEVTATAGTAQALGNETLIARHYREWLRHRAASMDPNTTDERYEEDYKRFMAEGDLIWALPAQSGADLAVKIVVWTDFGGFSLPSVTDAPKFWDEVQAMIGGAK